MAIFTAHTQEAVLEAGVRPSILKRAFLKRGTSPNTPSLNTPCEAVVCGALLRFRRQTHRV